MLGNIKTLRICVFGLNLQEGKSNFKDLFVTKKIDGTAEMGKEQVQIGRYMSLLHRYELLSEHHRTHLLCRADKSMPAQSENDGNKGLHLCLVDIIKLLASEDGVYVSPPNKVFLNCAHYMTGVLPCRWSQGSQTWGRRDTLCSRRAWVSNMLTVASGKRQCRWVSSLGIHCSE